MTTNRLNAEWVHDLKADAATRSRAIEELRRRLQRSISYYLSCERSDLTDLAPEEIDQMAQDFAQEALLRILANLDSFRGDSQFMTWAMKIVKHIASSEMRRARYRSVSLDKMINNGDLYVGATNAFTRRAADRPETLTEKHDIMQRIQRALEEVLSKRQRAVLEAVALDEAPTEMIAEQMGINCNALYKLVFDARRKLRAHLSEQGLPPDYILNVFAQN